MPTETAKPHQRLLCWQKTMELVVAVYAATKSFPKDETYGLVSQIRRAAVSAPANISEGAADRSTAEFENFLRIALGSLNELATLLEIAHRVGYLDQDLHAQLHRLLDECLALTYGLKCSLRR